ncbi:methionyl-tRNA formyltransferase [Microbispora sp. GKU 823]|uniref:methionyl-tRNA formyltransferase n=1 Tax=Microbispora sp. GKU 823 TaxID=1652100 RepID=UPI001C4DFD1C|nr:formyltransferase family protein [Microbispora sp. GKU 823]
MTDSMRIALIFHTAGRLTLLHEACVRAGHTPVALVHARSLRQGRPTSKTSAETIAAISEALPPGSNLLLPGNVDGLAQALAGYHPDLIVVYGFPWKLSREVLRAARIGVMNIHPSLLPKYRGPLPVQWAVRNGDPEIGVTIHWMTDDFDTGNIIAQKGGIRIAEDPVPAVLWKEVDLLVEDLLDVALENAAAGAPGEPQSDVDATYAGWMEPDFMFIDWARSAREIHNQVRAFRFNLFGLRGPFGKVRGKWMTVLRTRIEPAEGLRVECADGPIWITEAISAVPPDR